MPRTPLDRELIHTEADLAGDAARVEHWVARMSSACRPWVREALLRETAVTGAAAWVDPAAAALRSLLVDGGAELPRDAYVAELADALRAGISPPDEAEVERHALQFARVLVPSWVELLRRSLDTNAELDLDAHLLPVARAADPALVQHWLDALEGFGLRFEELTAAMTALAERAFGEQSAAPELELPSGLVLARADGAVVVRRGPHARDAHEAGRGAGILQSGEQRREGAAEPEREGHAARRPGRR